MTGPQNTFIQQALSAAQAHAWKGVRVGVYGLIVAVSLALAGWGFHLSLLRWAGFCVGLYFALYGGLDVVSLWWLHKKKGKYR